MTGLYQRLDELINENIGLAIKLEAAEAEICRLKSALEDANNEIGRLGMVFRHREESLQSIRRLGK